MLWKLVDILNERFPGSVWWEFTSTYSRIKVISHDHDSREAIVWWPGSTATVPPGMQAITFMWSLWVHPGHISSWSSNSVESSSSLGTQVRTRNLFSEYKYNTLVTVAKNLRQLIHSVTFPAIFMPESFSGQPASARSPEQTHTSSESLYHIVSWQSILTQCLHARFQDPDAGNMAPPVA